MKIEIEVEKTASYKLGFKHGLEEGVDMNPYDGEDIEKYCYRRGYDAGVSEYCRQEHPEDDKKALPYPFEEGDTYYTIEQGEVVESCWDDVSEEIYDENPNRRYFETKEEAEKDIKKMLDLCGDF